MKKICTFLVALVMSLGFSMSAMADVLIDSFEGGWNPAWQTYYADDDHQDPNRFFSTSLFESVGSDDTVFFAKDGNDLGVVQSGLFNYLSIRVIDFWVTTPSTFSMWVGTSFGDYFPFNDEAWVTLVDYATYSLQLQFQASVQSVGDFGTTYWNQLATEVQPGKYRLSVNAWNVGDDGFQSYLLVDDVRLTSHAVPEPTTFALLGIGLLGAVGLGRRRREVARI